MGKGRESDRTSGRGACPAESPLESRRLARGNTYMYTTDTDTHTHTLGPARDTSRRPEGVTARPPRRKEAPRG
eukprot:scaffold10717_cov155-Isochrysis_galbana.AAC.1